MGRRSSTVSTVTGAVYGRQKREDRRTASRRRPSPNQRYSPYVPVPVAEQRAGGPEDLDRRARPGAAGRVGESASPLRHYPYGEPRRPRARLHGPRSTTTSSKQGRPVRRDLHAERSDREVWCRARVTSSTCGAPRARGRSRSTRTANQPIRGHRGRRRPRPGDDLYLNINIDVQAQAEQALKTGLALAQDRACKGCKGPVVAKVGSSVVLDPHTGGVVWMASYPTDRS